jgi:transcription elongation factor Elf1
MAMQPAKPANIQTYVNEWVKVATGGNVVVDYAWNPDVNRMQLRCKKCDQALTCAIPEVPEKIDYALQKFVGLHRHATLVTTVITEVEWGYVPIAAKKQTRAAWDEEGRRFRE